MSARGVSAIVLAGGRSSRFGRDKLAEPIDGKALLDHAIDAVRVSADEIIVVVAPNDGRSVPPGVRLVRDDAAFEGPLAGLLAGLRAAREPVVVVTAGDMPEVQPAVIEALLAALAGSGVDAAVLEEAGRSRPLPMAVKRDPATAAAERLIAGGERRLRALLEAITTTVIAEADWRVLDSDGRSLHDVDTPDDLP